MDKCGFVDEVQFLVNDLKVIHTICDIINEKILNNDIDILLSGDIYALLFNLINEKINQIDALI